jgi:hypothetical protein
VRRCVFVAMLMLASVSSAAAQNKTPQPSDPALEFLPGYSFHLNMEHLSHADPRYVWDTNFGGELGIVGYGTSRLTFVVNYQAILGEEFHPFDPNQGNYILEGDLTTEYDGFEIGGVFYHQSRHLADRPKRQPVDWNMLGARGRKRFVVGPTELDARVDLRYAVLRTFVDYQWELDAGLRAKRHLYRAIDLVGGANFRQMGVDDSRGRDNQTGFRLDGGLRFRGKAAAVELFLALERRIDAYPTEFGPEIWASIGMRLLSP